MILNLIRMVLGYNWDWRLERELLFSNGRMLFYICRKTGRMKKVWLGSWD